MNKNWFLNACEVQSINYLEKDFLKICDSKFENDEYYKIVSDVYYYDGVSTYDYSVAIKVPETYYAQCFNWLGNEKTVRKERLVNKLVTIYAVRNSTGIYEMVTGKKVAIYGHCGQFYCYGVQKQHDLKDIEKTLRFLESNPEYKEQYTRELALLSNNVWEHRKRIAEREEAEQRENDSAIQYVKSYKVPHV